MTSWPVGVGGGGGRCVWKACLHFVAAYVRATPVVVVVVVVVAAGFALEDNEYGGDIGR